MAKGPFGNPLSTGIALSGVIDMTPYRQMHARKMAKLEDEKKEKKRKKKELAGILSKVTLDEDKIFWRQHDNAKIQYADTIDKITTMYNNEDYSGMYKTMNDFSMDMGNLMQENASIKSRASEIAKGGKYYDPVLEAMQNNRDVSNEDYARALEEAGYGDISEKGIYSYTPLQNQVNLNKEWGDALKGIDHMLITGTGTPTEKGKIDATRIMQAQIDPVVYDQKKEQIKQSIRANPHLRDAFFRDNGKDIKAFAFLPDAQKLATQEQWLEEIVGGAGEGYRYKEDKITDRATADSGFSWTASSGRNKNWSWSLAPGDKININDAGGPKELDVDKRLSINRVSGGVAINNFTVGKKALKLDPTTGAFIDAGYPSNTTIQGTPTGILEVGGKKYVELTSTSSLTDKQEDRYLQLARLVSPSAKQTAEKKQLEKLRVSQTLLEPYAGVIESQVFNSMGIAGDQVDKMRGYMGGSSSTSSSSSSSSSSSGPPSLNLLLYNSIKGMDMAALRSDPTKAAKAMKIIRAIPAAELDVLWKKTGAAGTVRNADDEVLDSFITSGVIDDLLVYFK